MSRKAFIKYINISSNDIKKFDIYADHLVKWQNNIGNIVSKDSLKVLWSRHFLDSAQIYYIINKRLKGNCIDFGSGAGFPGMVINLLGYRNITLIEANKNKVQFLKELIKFTNSSSRVIHGRIENNNNLKPKIITARAVSKLNKLINLIDPYRDSLKMAIFPKGKTYLNEIEEAKKFWNFDYSLVPSITNKDSMIIVIKEFERASKK